MTKDELKALPNDVTAIPLYTHPPQRTWVGLTTEEIIRIGMSFEGKDRRIQDWGLFACAIEAKLKEKNTDAVLKTGVGQPGDFV